MQNLGKVVQYVVTDRRYTQVIRKKRVSVTGTLIAVTGGHYERKSSWCQYRDKNPQNQRNKIPHSSNSAAGESGNIPAFFLASIR